MRALMGDLRARIRLRLKVHSHVDTTLLRFSASYMCAIALCVSPGIWRANAACTENIEENSTSSRPLDCGCFVAALPCVVLDPFCVDGLL